jgi:two-component system, cell cycle sensor histidine kinase and response regulator CckA
MMSQNAPPCVLIAEDEEELRGLLAMVFEVEGFLVLQARDGQEALDLYVAHQARVQLIITDLGLPRLGGVDMIARVRALSPTVRIIAASGFGRENVRQKVLDAGGDEFVPKPFKATDLVEIARALMKSRDRRRGKDGVAE